MSDAPLRTASEISELTSLTIGASSAAEILAASRSSSSASTTSRSSSKPFMTSARVPAESKKTATNQKKIRDFVAAEGITRFHDIRGDVGGICHQILPENGYVRPGQVVVGTDSHTTSHGALGAFAFGIGATEMAAVWALGKVLNGEYGPWSNAAIEGPTRSSLRYLFP